MSLLSKVRMSPSEDKQIGDIPEHERQRTQSVGSDAKAVEKADEPKRGWADPEREHPADQTSAQSVLQTGSRWLGLQTTRAYEQQLFIGRDQTTSPGSVEEKISGVWTNAGVREVGREREVPAFERNCAETDDRGGAVESAQSKEGGGPSTARAACLLWRTGPN